MVAPIGGGLQMDQVALPLVLAYQLRRTDRHTWLKHIKPAADFILRKGPATDPGALGGEAGLLAVYNRGRNRRSRLRSANRRSQSRPGVQRKYLEAS